jgi:hypothetical protein
MFLRATRHQPSPPAYRQAGTGERSVRLATEARVRGDRENNLGVFDLLKGRGQGVRGGPEPPAKRENRTYDELIDEIMKWNIEQTDILSVLRKEIEEGRLDSWSLALETGVRRGLDSASGPVDKSPLFPIFLDLHKFIRGLRTKLLTNPTMKNVRKMEKADSLSVCIICGIRALQKERGAKKLIDTIQWMLLERYLG